MKAVALMPLAAQCRWEGPWMTRQGEEWRKAIGGPTREEEAVLQGQADRASRAHVEWAYSWHSGLNDL